MKSTLERVSKVILGPKSRYIRTLPYAYSARRRIFSDTEDHVWYVADTVCLLIEQLAAAGIHPHDVEMFEVFRHAEIAVERVLFSDEQGQWQMRPVLCTAFADRYPSHPCDGSRCAFKDRQ